ncbi:LOW QUALITY PROTEIN: hypothetical protein PHMEG_00012758 [Phytophthora megakarya]|uniref:Uncharacterized protein n=1 Tax=Phytophthora megakarya TaxID=4795 RepID=A0A225W8F3_9STRA|nr:LOW QUALITY PROTEIN: hypothetical protein PHMEG_00012758 [Phytophthora megakarya]
MMLSRQCKMADQTTQDITWSSCSFVTVSKSTFKNKMKTTSFTLVVIVRISKGILPKNRLTIVSKRMFQLSRRNFEWWIRAVHRQPRLDVDLDMNFQNANSQLSLQLPRLRSHLEHCRENTQAHSSWRTTISIMTADDPSVSTSAYVPEPLQDDDGDEKNTDDSLSQDHPRVHSWILPMNRRQSLLTVVPTVNVHRKDQRKPVNRCHPMCQLRFKNTLPHGFASQTTHAASDLLLRDVEAPREMLTPFPVVWSNLRLDVRAIILYGVNYEGAMEWLGEDCFVHGCFHQGPRLEMLLRMMF